MHSFLPLLALSVSLLGWAPRQYWLGGPPYSTGYKLPHSATLYRTIRAARGGHYARRLRAGQAVLLVKEYPHWLKVVWANYVPNKGYSDTSCYYLRASAVAGASRFEIH